MVMKLYQYTTFALTLFSSTILAQSNISVLEQGKKIESEGNTANTLPTVIGEHTISDIQRITFDDKKMYVATTDDSISYEINRVYKVKVGGAIDMQSAYLPASMAKRLNFDDEKNWTLVLDSISAHEQTIGAKQSAKITFSAKKTEFVNSVKDLTIKDSANVIVVNNNAGNCDIVLSGKASDKKILLSGSSETRFVLEGVNLATEDDASIISKSSSKMYINTAKGSFNTLSGIEALEGNGEIILSGEGNLLLTANRDYSALLSAKKALKINGGAISLVARGNAEQGIASGETIDVYRGLINVVTFGNSLYNYNTYNESSAIAFSANKEITINGGKVNIKSIGGDGAMGFGAGQKVTINGGDICIMSFDNCIKSAESVTVKGGRLFCTSIMSDGIDSGSLIDFQGGIITVFGPYPQNNAIDNKGKAFAIGRGCTFIGVGANCDSPWEYKSTQSSLLVKNLHSDRFISVKDAAGNELIAFETPNHPEMTFVISTPSVVPNAKYSVYGYPSCESGREYMSIIDKGEFKEGKSVTIVTAMGHK